jgi:hypothetical protein
MEDDHKKNENGRQPQKLKTTSNKKTEENLKKYVRKRKQNYFFSQFLSNLGQTFPGVG